MPEQTGLRQRHLPLTADLPSVLAATLLLVSGACAPPPLTGQPDAGSGDAGPFPTDSALETDGDTVTDTDKTGIEFVRVADILRDNCTKAGCHAANGNANFAVEGGQSASSAEVAEALEGTSVPEEDTLLIEPHKPLDSALYQAMVGSNGRTQMPLGGELPDEEISLIERWIAQGASYE